MKLSVIFNVLLLVICCFSFYFLIISENSNDRLIRQINLKDSLSKKTTKKDSVFAEKTKEYAKVITKYISDCNFKIGDKSISTPELLRISNKAIRDVELYKDSLRVSNLIIKEYEKFVSKTQNDKNVKSDSTLIYKKLYNLISKYYGIKSSYRKEGDTYYFQIDGAPSLDSALVLFPYYKHYLSKDSSGNWQIYKDSKRNIKRYAEKNGIKN